MSVIEVSCGCEVITDTATGILRSSKKCVRHKRMRAKQPTGLAYYQGLGTVCHDGKPANVDTYVSEFIENMGDLEPACLHKSRLLLEVGCGMSPYVEYIRRRGYLYIGIDPDPQVAVWMQSTYGAKCYCGKFPECHVVQVDAILMAHVLEHIEDAPGALRECHKSLKPNSCLYIIVPDDSDLANPDHLWFFSKSGLCSLLESLNFAVAHAAEAQIVKKEKFIYIKARKQ